LEKGVVWKIDLWLYIWNNAESKINNWLIKVKFSSNIVLIKCFYNNTNDLINALNINIGQIKRVSRIFLLIKIAKNLIQI
jgi:hypothetical protein